jgi:beta-lactamase class A
MSRESGKLRHVRQCRGCLANLQLAREQLPPAIKFAKNEGRGIGRREKDILRSELPSSHAKLVIYGSDAAFWRI